jgi:hypothetical protein
VRRVTLAFTFFWRRVTGARGCGRAFGRRHLPPRRHPRLAGGLRGGHMRGGGACVQHRRGGTKRAHAAAVGLPASLGFAAWGGSAMEEAAAEGGME